MMVVCKDQLDKLQAAGLAGPDAASAAALSNAAVENEITSLLSGKTYDQLVQLQRQIQGKLGSGEPVDVDYWEGLLKSLLVWKAKVCSYVVFYYISLEPESTFSQGQTDKPS